jgi:UDP-N-acetylglucosamine--N-acetylmuramyl-(pentapeptide) pyrophosphoryl-undecaprenol N-acetylglucosamine transferase
MIAQGWQVVHQMGETTVLPEAREGYHPAAYLEELWQLYAVADLAVARAGAMSIAELSAMRVPTIYVPLPWAAQDHQRHNVEPLVAAGAAKLLPQAELTCERLLSEMDLAASDKAAQMRTLIAEGLPDPCAATDKLVRLLGEVARDL